MPGSYTWIIIIIGLAILGAWAGSTNTRSRWSSGAGTKPPTESKLVAINGRLPYRRQQLLTNAERSFYGVLRGAVGTELDVFAKVRLGDLVSVEPGTPNFYTYNNTINMKHVDFVLCDPNTVSPVLVIELDDASHGRADRAERDAVVDNILRDAGLKVVRFPAKAGYSVSEISAQVKSALYARAN